MMQSCKHGECERQELVLLLREVMRWEKRTRQENRGDAYLNGEIDMSGKPRNEGVEFDDQKDAWDDLTDILNRAHVAISTDSRRRPRQRPQKKAVLTAR